MTKTTRLGVQKNPATLRPTDLTSEPQTTHGYRQVLEGFRSLIAVKGWDAAASVAAAITTRYNALKAIPSQLGSTGVTLSHIDPDTGPAVGTKITASVPPFDGTPKPTFAFQWIRGASTDISGATSQSYTVVADDIGNTLKCEITFSNSEGDTVVVSSPTPAAIAAA